MHSAPNVVYNKPAPGVTQASTTMHAGQTSVHQGATGGSRTANGANIGEFAAAQHTMPEVHYNKPQFQTTWGGTYEHRSETSVHKGAQPGSRTAQPDSEMPVAGNWKA